MAKNSMLAAIGILLIGLIGCEIKTPEIRGVVLDAETKLPVEGAWVHATIGVKTKSVAGDVGQVISLDPPHTRTGVGGKFVIPSKALEKPSFPVSFGAEVDNIGIGASTVDDRAGGVNFKGEKSKEILKKAEAELTIYIKPTERTEIEYFSHLQSLYNYCRTGRFGIEVPPVEGGCDEWELNYAIGKHKRYLARYKDPKKLERPGYGISKFEDIIHYSGVMRQLAYLYEKKEDFKGSFDLFKEVRDFDIRHGLSSSLKEYELEINQLQKKLGGK